MANWALRPGAVVVVATACLLVSSGELSVDRGVAVTEPVSSVADVDSAARAPRASTATGALFADGSHFCSASVVDSPAGNLVLTAAHCVNGGSAGLSFAPGYHDGIAPYGWWTVTAVAVPGGWAASADPDLDFAFLTVEQDGDPHSVQQLAGADTLGFDRGYTNPVTITGYPDTGDSPVACRNTTTRFGPYQQRIACPGFPDGTSGGPWVTAVNPATGDGTVIGVIGGYEQGGDTPDVSYSAYFDHDIRDLYRSVLH
ncbi:serine protease [Amycolatopsis sp.]|uniref:trypsin-like serine peptidase n=1 Tax=Amycolatopsis sp. TaxID=37632 RepID=UPI002C956517|nr:serine protease [Amycolatopsis sp.]HVV12583.1 serine protease [Amycolatopsis sp.]